MEEPIDYLKIEHLDEDGNPIKPEPLTGILSTPTGLPEDTFINGPSEHKVRWLKDEITPNLTAGEIPIETKKLLANFLHKRPTKSQDKKNKIKRKVANASKRKNRGR